MNHYINKSDISGFEVEPKISTETLMEYIRKLDCIQSITEIEKESDMIDEDGKGALLIDLKISYEPPINAASILFLFPTSSLTEYKFQVTYFSDKSYAISNSQVFEYKRNNIYWLFFLPLTPFLIDQEFEKTILNQFINDVKENN